MKNQCRQKLEIRAQGMNEEMDSLVRNQTWDLVQFPKKKRALQNKWVYRLKE